MRKTAGGIIIVIAVIGAVAWMFWDKEDSSQSLEDEDVTKVTFQCEAGKSVGVTFQQKSVVIKLSDSRSMRLQQVQSASGARYANQDESVVFWNKGNTALLIEEGQKTYTNCVEEGEINNADVKTYKSGNNIFAIRYPSVFEVAQSGNDGSLAWSYSTAEAGTVGLKLLMPASYQPKTNFREAVFLVGWSKQEQAVEQCLQSPAGNVMETEEVIANGIKYHYTKYGDAGAGNFYEVDQYRTVREGTCYSIEQMVHSTNLGNYSPDQDITAFDKERVRKVLEQAWNGFQFL